MPDVVMDPLAMCLLTTALSPLFAWLPPLLEQAQSAVTLPFAKTTCTATLQTSPIPTVPWLQPVAKIAQPCHVFQDSFAMLIPRSALLDSPLPLELSALEHLSALLD